DTPWRRRLRPCCHLVRDIAGVARQPSRIFTLRIVMILKTFLAFFLVTATAFAQEAVYKNDFESAEVGKVPADMMVLDGGFKVVDDNGNKVLELPGAPLETFGVLFGPTEKENRTVSARVFGTSKGRRA